MSWLNTLALPWGAWAAGASVLAFISLAKLHSYLLFHSLAEMFSIAVSLAIFMIFWNTRRFTKNGYFNLIGVSLFFVGLLDLLHTLAYKGMGVFIGFDANLPTQLWIGARGLQAGALLAAPAFIERPLSAGWTLGGGAVLTGALLLAVFTGVFPDCYIEGSGLTPFKIVGEYVICIILGASFLLHVRRRRSLSPKGLRYLLSALVLAILSELAFTSYLGVFDSANALGHILKIVSFGFIYRAMVETTLLEPYEGIFKGLRQAQQNMRTIFNNVHDAVFIHGIDGAILDVNDKMLELYGVEREEALRLSIKDDYSDPGNPLDKLGSIWAKVVSGTAMLFEWNARRPKDGLVFPVEVFLRKITLEDRDVILAMVRDITDRKRVEGELERLSRTDGLTGIGNRRYFDDMLVKEWRIGQREQSSLALLIADIDHFKLYNDRYGHLLGDECLKSVARTISATPQRPGDVAARYGGEEFVVILPRTSSSGAHNIARQILQAVRDLALEHADSPLGVVTVSVGVAWLVPDSSREPADLVAMADKSLYEAKTAGRDREVCKFC